MSEINIKDVAKLANVGITTVSRVLNNSAVVSNELTERVLKAIEETGYTGNPLARTLKSAKTNTIALIVTSLRRNFFIEIIEGVTDVCKANQYSVHILETEDSIENEMKIMDSLVQQWIDGIILVSCVSERTEKTAAYLKSLSQLKKKGIPIPVVQLEVPSLNDCVDSVVVNHEESAFHAVMHLIEIGRKNIAYISIPRYAMMAEQRMNGYYNALKQSGLSIDTDLVVYGDYNVIDGYNNMMKLLDVGKPIDALFAANDQMAVGALFACKERGLSVPQDIAIIGNDSVALSIITSPAISTISIPKYKYGQIAANLILSRIREPKVEAAKGQVITINTEVVIRESTLQSAKKSLEFMLNE